MCTANIYEKDTTGKRLMEYFRWTPLGDVNKYVGKVHLLNSKRKYLLFRFSTLS